MKKRKEIKKIITSIGRMIIWQLWIMFAWFIKKKPSCR